MLRLDMGSVYNEAQAKKGLIDKIIDGAIRGAFQRQPLNDIQAAYLSRAYRGPIAGQIRGSSTSKTITGSMARSGPAQSNLDPKIHHIWLQAGLAGDQRSMSRSTKGRLICKKIDNALSFDYTRTT